MAAHSALPAMPALLRRLFQQRLRCVLFLLSLVVLVIYLLLVSQDYCSMEGRLGGLLAYTNTLFTSAGITYWLDYGTLLGAVREDAILSHEFDLDMGVPAEMCDRIYALREQAFAAGYGIYKRGEYIARKKSNLPWGIDNGYLSMPCVRVYNPSGVYVDVYDYTRIESTKIDTYGRYFYLPPRYTPADGDIMCNNEGFHEKFRGGCSRESDLLPTKPSRLGPLPNNPERMLSAMYGDDWRIPRAKGIKIVLCPAVPRDPLLLLLATALVIALPILLLIIPLPYSGSMLTQPKRWDAPV